MDTAGGGVGGGPASYHRGGAATLRPPSAADESPWQQGSLSDAGAAASGSAPVIQETSLTSPAPLPSLNQGAGESSSLPILSHTAELLAKLAKDMQPTASQAQAMPLNSVQANDISVLGVWSPSSGISANGAHTAQVNFETGLSSSYQTDKIHLFTRNLFERISGL